MPPRAATTSSGAREKTQVLPAALAVRLSAALATHTDRHADVDRRPTRRCRSLPSSAVSNQSSLPGTVVTRCSWSQPRPSSLSAPPCIPRCRSFDGTHSQRSVSLSLRACVRRRSPYGIAAESPCQCCNAPHAHSAPSGSSGHRRTRPRSAPRMAVLSASMGARALHPAVHGTQPRRSLHTRNADGRRGTPADARQHRGWGVGSPRGQSLQRVSRQKFWRETFKHLQGVVWALVGRRAPARRLPFGGVSKGKRSTADTNGRRRWMRQPGARILTGADRMHGSQVSLSVER